MADVTINYEGNAIATMSASGTKTLLTEGKYCTDDIEVVYVSPGGGGSASSLYGNITPAENLTAVTIAVLAGITNDMFLFKPTGNAGGVLNQNVRAIGLAFEDFTSGKQCTFSIGTNSTGTSFNATHRSATNGDTEFNLDRSTGIVSVANAAGSGYLIGGVAYDWWSWGV